MTIEFVRERQNIVVEGEKGDKFYILHSGKATVFKNVKSEIGVTNLVRALELFTLNLASSSRFESRRLIWGVSLTTRCSKGSNRYGSS